jgi:hypothetical protein
MSFGDVLRDPIAWDGITRGLLTAAGYALGVLACRVGPLLQQGRHRLSCPQSGWCVDRLSGASTYDLV